MTEEQKTRQFYEQGLNATHKFIQTMLEVAKESDNAELKRTIGALIVDSMIDVDTILINDGIHLAVIV